MKKTLEYQRKYRQKNADKIHEYNRKISPAGKHVAVKILQKGVEQELLLQSDFSLLSTLIKNSGKIKTS